MNTRAGMTTRIWKHQAVARWTSTYTGLRTCRHASRGLAFMLLLFAASSVSAQSMDANFLPKIRLGAGSNGADRLEVTVHVKPQTDFSLGTSTLMFTFNNDGLELPSGVAGNETLVLGVDYDLLPPFDSLSSNSVYGNSTATLFGGTDRLSINIVLDSTSAGAVVASTGMSIARFNFDILSDLETSQLSWVNSTQPNGTVLKMDDNLTVVPNGNLIDRDDLLDIQLPVELTSFDGTVDNQTAILLWATSRETDVTSFEVQHQSSESEDWNRDGLLPQSDTVNPETGERNYRHQTNKLDFGRHKFRLRVVDAGGLESILEETELRVYMDVPVVVGVPYPNPASARATLPLAVQIPQQVTITAVDVLGRKAAVLFDAPVIANTTHYISLQLDGLATGTYFLLIEGDEIREVGRVSVMR